MATQAEFSRSRMTPLESQQIQVLSKFRTAMHCQEY
jgi:hypothetical protein